MHSIPFLGGFFSYWIKIFPASFIIYFYYEFVRSLFACTFLCALMLKIIEECFFAFASAFALHSHQVYYFKLVLCFQLLCIAFYCFSSNFLIFASAIVIPFIYRSFFMSHICSIYTGLKLLFKPIRVHLPSSWSRQMTEIK